MHRLEQKAGIDLEGMRLEDVADMTARIFAHVSAYPVRPKPPLDPTLADANIRQRRALFSALEEKTKQWPETDRQAVAAMLDVLWSVATYERLASDWDMDSDQAIQAVIWLIDLVQARWPTTAAHVEPPKGLAGSTSVTDAHDALPCVPRENRAPQ